MNMLGKMFGGLIDKEAAVKDTIGNAIEDVCEELNCKPTEMFFMIQPTGVKFEFKVHIYRKETGKAPQHVREISVKEIVGENEE